MNAKDHARRAVRRLLDEKVAARAGNSSSGPEKTAAIARVLRMAVNLGCRCDRCAARAVTMRTCAGRAMLGCAEHGEMSGIDKRRARLESAMRRR
jgi:hypothetical protein